MAKGKKKLWKWRDVVKNGGRIPDEKKNEDPRERAGRCNNCSAGSFKVALHKGRFIRKCKTCHEVYDVEAAKTIRKGERVE